MTKFLASPFEGATRLILANITGLTAFYCSAPIRTAHLSVDQDGTVYAYTAKQEPQWLEEQNCWFSRWGRVIRIGKLAGLSANFDASQAKVKIPVHQDLELH